MLHAIHLNDVYLMYVPKVNGFASDSKWVQYLLNVLNCFELKHFASYFEVMSCVSCVQTELMLKNQSNVQHDHCDELNDDVG